MDRHIQAPMPRPLRGESAQDEQNTVLQDMGAPARPGVGRSTARGSKGGLSPAIEWFEERAAVIEYEAGKARIHAESLALQEVVAHLGKEAGREAYDHMHARRAAA